MQMKFNRQDNQTKNYLGSLIIILRNLYLNKKATADFLVKYENISVRDKIFLF